MLRYQLYKSNIAIIFIDKAVLAITDRPPYYKAFMKNLEEEGYELIGYIRACPTMHKKCLS